MSGRRIVRVLARRLGAGGGSEEGFTIVEVLVAAFVLTLGALGVFMTLSAGIKNVQRGKDGQVAIGVAQREMEKIHSYPYDSVALSSTPTTSGEAGNPNSRVSGPSFNLKRSGIAENATMVISGSGALVKPGPESFDVEGTKGQIYRYVVWRTDPAYCQSYPSKSVCKAGQVYKRVVVVAWLNKASNQSSRPAYYELQSDFVDPTPE